MPVSGVAGGGADAVAPAPGDGDVDGDVLSALPSALAVPVFS
jgi:hypothetical protein